MMGGSAVRSFAIVFFFGIAATFGAVADDDRVAIPMNGGGPATFDPNMPSYLFAQHVLREPGELVKLDKGIVGLMGAKYPNAIFAVWDDFEAYATCTEDVPLKCDVSYFDYADGEIRTYVLPFEAANDRVHLTFLADPTSDESQKTPPTGTALKAVKDTLTPSSGFSTYLSYGPPEVRRIEPGVIAVYVNRDDFPQSLYVSGEGFEARGVCIEGRFGTDGCQMNFFDHQGSVIDRYSIRLPDALKLSTYVNLIQH